VALMPGGATLKIVCRLPTEGGREDAVAEPVNGSLRVELLGPVRAWLGGTEIVLGSPMQRSVLAMLAASANSVVDRSRLLNGLWGQDRPASALGMIQTYVAVLRQALEPDRPSRTPAKLLRSVGDGYLLELEPANLDVAVLEGLRERAVISQKQDDHAGVVTAVGSALELWHGTALTGVPGACAARSRERLAELRLWLVETRAEARLTLGEHDRVATELAAELNEAPSRENLARLLMLAQFRAGRQAEAISTFHRISGALSGEFGVRPAARLAELHQQILVNDPALELNATQAARSIQIANPAQLPHLDPGFVGRATELADLHAYLAAHRTEQVAVAITGTAGVGKSELAVRFARSVLADYPDGQLYVDLHGFSASRKPLPSESALGRLLRTFGFDAGQIPSEVREQRKLFLNSLDGRRMLVMLDDVAAFRQVAPLLPSMPGCLGVLTSRKRLEQLPAYVYRVQLEALKPEEAATLLMAGAGTVDEQPELATLAELASLCDHLPLALRIAAERISGYGDGAIKNLLTEMTTESRLDVLDAREDEMTSVRATFAASYDALEPEAARTFRLLGLHPATEIGLAAAASLLGTGESGSRRLLALLVSENLLAESGANSFRMPRLLHDYAGECARGLSDASSDPAP
jgi:DNA-binding SARP family transcriptional activator